MSSAQNTNLSRKADIVLWNKGKYADIKVICQGKSWLLHRSILGSRCQWFSEIMEGLRKNGKYYELKMDAWKPDLVRTVMYFIYSGEVYHEALKDKPVDYEVHSRLYQLGGYFEFKEFQAAQLAKCSTHLDRRAAGHKNRGNKFNNNNIERILRGVRFTYKDDEDETADLRKLYVGFFVECFPYLAKHPYFHEQLRHMPLFSADLLKALGLSGFGAQSR